MKSDFIIDLLGVKPSQLYICSEKLYDVLSWFKPDDLESYKALPIKILKGNIIFTDGHTRAYAAHLGRVEKIKVYWDEGDWNWPAYEICLDWCEEEGIRSIKDLANRIIAKEEYDLLWLDRCKKMHMRVEQGLSR